MNKWPASVKHFLWGTIFGVVLVPILYVVRLWMKHRGESIEIDETEWP